MLVLSGWAQQTPISSNLEQDFPLFFLEINLFLLFVSIKRNNNKIYNEGLYPNSIHFTIAFILESIAIDRKFLFIAYCEMYNQFMDCDWVK